MPSSEYLIKEGYRCNLSPAPARTRSFSRDVREISSYQVDVYRLARRIIKMNHLRSVLDIGCGFGEKLKEHVLPVCSDITGIDTEHCISYCRRTYQFGKWLVDDIERPRPNPDRRYELVIAADVIEHLFNPDRLLDYIRNHSDENTRSLVSTTERDIVRGKLDPGPPANPAHVREWNWREFETYMGNFNLEILGHFLVTGSREHGIRRVMNVLELTETILRDMLRGESITSAAHRFVTQAIPRRSCQVILARSKFR